MDLLLEGTRFALLRHMMSSPLHIFIMVVVILAAMAAAMMRIFFYGRRLAPIGITSGMELRSACGYYF
jgi:hypothetical protein